MSCVTGLMLCIVAVVFIILFVGHILAIYYLAEIYAKGLTGRRNCDQAVEVSLLPLLQRITCFKNLLLNFCILLILVI